MTVNYEAETSTKGVLKFEIGLEEVNRELNIAFKKVQPQLNVPGFRKGKVPRQIFNNVYGEEVLYNDVLDKILPGAVDNALEKAEEQGIKSEIQTVTDVSIEKGEPWVITLELISNPEVKLGEYKNLEATVPSAEVTQAVVDARLKALQEQYAELVLSEEAAKDGDTVVIDYAGFLDGEQFEGGTSQNYSLQLGSGTFIPGFEDQLVGAKAGEERSLDITFPEDYHADLAGKDVVFEVKVHEVKTRSLPELDDDFAMDVNSDVETLDELIEVLKEEEQKRLDNAREEALEEQVLGQAIENAEFVDFPEELVNEEVQRQLDFELNQYERQGISAEFFYQITGSSEEQLREELREPSETRVKLNLVLEAIADAEGFEISDEDVDGEVMELSENFGIEPAQVEQMVTRDMLAKDVKLKKARNLVLESANVTEED